ncbi:MAG: dihydrofolate synthase / folylpolyglutamate synthase [Solirubrobacteraceae bacterium]|nr:dihydrofolate synthase / folylpolyglutamate synthase [Solirubrobacteraceae bacterium]MEA2290765.1 dihydrofolate synthase / folylpolyglutamate synthase [Solirubrobacteraceae bacterium]
MTYDEAERYLLSLELFGMRFGLDRMRRLTTALGTPQERYGSVHVAGTNGKSSTVRMTAAILRRHGLRAGAYLSPHLVSFAERIRIDDADLPPERFAAAVARAAHAADMVNRTLADDDRVTQFEALTAAAYSELAEAQVDVAVIEAGLGGRYDATNVIPSRVQVLTNVGLEHTRWLGPTVADVAAEKLDIVQPGGTLVVGADLAEEAMALARSVTADRGAKLVVAPADTGLELLAQGEHQQRNFAVARAAAEAYLGPLDDTAVREAAASTLVPGRFQIVDEAPATVIDGAHNAAGMTALAQSLRTFVAGRRLVGCVSVLDDKDAAGMLRALLPLCAEVVFTTSANPRALPAATLESLSRQLGGPPARTVGEPRRALRAAREAAGPDGVVVATGSIYLIADLLRPEGVRGRSML